MTMHDHNAPTQRRPAVARTYKDLELWQAAVQLAKEVYEATNAYPKEEAHGLASQMRRAAVSIASNIAEGSARHGGKEFIRFLSIAVGSANELDTQLEISKAINIADNETLTKLQASTTRVTMMACGLIRSLKQRKDC